MNVLHGLIWYGISFTIFIILIIEKINLANFLHFGLSGSPGAVDSQKTSQLSTPRSGPEEGVHVESASIFGLQDELGVILR